MTSDPPHFFPRPTSSLGARTTVVTLAAPRETVFNFLADIENLPRWAGGFCESLRPGRDRWMALTSLGEMFLELEASVRTGQIVFSAGWEPGSLYKLPLQITRGAEEGTRVKFSLAAAADERHLRLHLALEAALRDLVGRFDERAFLPPG